MIWDSVYWKNDLLRMAKEMTRKKNMLIWRDRSFAKFEKDIFYTFFAIRKLAEANKLSDDTVSMAIKLRICPPKLSNVTNSNWHNIERFFYLNRREDGEKTLKFVCDQMIHSYIFCPVFDENNMLEGVLFSSDFQRNKKLFFVDIDTVITILNICGNDFPNKVVKTYDEKKKDFVISSRMIKEP